MADHNHRNAQSGTAPANSSFTKRCCTAYDQPASLAARRVSFYGGTKSSNPVCSSGESVANLTSSPCRPQVDPRRLGLSSVERFGGLLLLGGTVEARSQSASIATRCAVGGSVSAW